MLQFIPDGGQIHGKREARREQIDEIVDHEAAKGGGQQIGTEGWLSDDGDFGAVPGLRVAAGENRHRDPHEVERVAGRVGDVVALVDPAQLMEVVEIPRQMVEMDCRLETDGVGSLHSKRGKRLGGCSEGGRAGDHRLSDGAASHGIGDEVCDAGRGLDRLGGCGSAGGGWRLPYRHG